MVVAALVVAACAGGETFEASSTTAEATSTAASVLPAEEPAESAPSDPSAIQRELTTPGPGRQPVEITIDAPNAEVVTLEMAANQWNFDPEDTIELPRVDDDRGSHAITLYLGEDEWVYRFRVDGAWTVDASNPRRVGAEDGRENSLLVVGETLPAVTERPDVAKGSVEEVFLSSEILGRDHPLLVYTPPGYTTDQQYPLLLLLHGYGDPPSTWVEVIGVHHAMDNLLADGEAVPFVMAMPSAETSTYMWDEYDDHILDEVLPFLDANYSLDPTPASTAIAGVSMGGHGAVQLAYLRQDRFGLALPVMMAAPYCQGLVCDDSSDLDRHYPEGFDIDISMWVGANDELGLLRNHELFAEYLETQTTCEHVVTTSDGHHQDGHSSRYVRTIIPDVLRRASDHFEE